MIIKIILIAAGAISAALLVFGYFTLRGKDSGMD